MKCFSYTTEVHRNKRITHATSVTRILSGFLKIYLTSSCNELETLFRTDEAILDRIIIM